MELIEFLTVGDEPINHIIKLLVNCSDFQRINCWLCGNYLGGNGRCVICSIHQYWRNHLVPGIVLYGDQIYQSDFGSIRKVGNLLGLKNIIMN